MLICNQAYMDGKKIMCKQTNNICVHVRYCAVSMKYYQTDNAKECVIKDKEKQANMTL